MLNKRLLCVVLLFVCLSLGGQALAQVPGPMLALPTPTPEPPIGLVPVSEGAPEEGEALPESATATPGVEEMPPETTISTPTVEKTILETPALTPNVEKNTQNAGISTSNAGTSTPNAEEQTPGAGAVTPEATATPAGTQTPESAAPNAASPSPAAQTIAPEGSPAPSETPPESPTTEAPTAEAPDAFAPDPGADMDCGVPGCPHVGPNEWGDVVALCEVGRWMLEAAGGDADAADEPKEPERMALENGVNVIYRDGSYELTGGGTNACLYVRGGLTVSLTFEDAELLTLKLSSGAAVSLRFTGRSSVQTLAADGAAVDVDGTGSLTIRNNLNCDELTVLGGSVSLPKGAQSRNGCVPVRFAAADVEQATLDGAFLTELESDETGTVTVWLPPIEGTYVGTVNGSTLDIQALY